MFQFTHPVWGATARYGGDADDGGVSIHAPRVGCDIIDTPLFEELEVSIHAPRVGCDLICLENLFK